MPTYSASTILTSICLSLLVFACGGNKPAESPDDADVAQADDESEASTGTESDDADKGGEASDASDDEPAADKDEPEAPAKDEGPKLTRTPKDIVTAPDVVFMLSYNDSDPKKEAEKKCDESAGKDPKKKNECMAKARKKVTIDGLQFKQEDGKWVWLTLRKQGARLINLHKVQIDFGKEDKDHITIKPQGKDKGVKPWGRVPKEVVIEVPNEYQIVVEDPDLGKLVYDAKIGIVGN